MKTGMLAAEAIFNEHESEDFEHKEIKAYEKSVRESWVNEELY